MRTSTCELVNKSDEMDCKVRAIRNGRNRILLVYSFSSHGVRMRTMTFLLPFRSPTPHRGEKSNETKNHKYVPGSGTAAVSGRLCPVGSG